MVGHRKITYVADAPGDSALLAGSRCLVCLALNACSCEMRSASGKMTRRVRWGAVGHTQIHDVVAADCAVVNDNVPSPQSNGVPLRPWMSALLFSPYVASEVIVGSPHLLHLEALLALDVTTLLFGDWRGVSHIDVSHGVVWCRMWDMVGLETAGEVWKKVEG